MIADTPLPRVSESHEAARADGSGRLAIRPWEWASAGMIAAFFVAIRGPLFTHPGLLLGWNSDSALIGLMARAMRDGDDFPLFFRGQRYLGTLPSIATAALGAVMEVGPLALRIASAALAASAFILFWAALRRISGRAAAMLALAWLAAGPSWLFAFTAATLAVEPLLLAAGLLFWFVTRRPLATFSDWLIAGAIGGAGMWLHQGIAFMGVAVAVALVVERLVRIRSVVAGAIGFAIGYTPAIVELIRNEPILYRREIPPWNVARVFENLAETLRGDLWLLLAHDDAIGVGTAAGILLLAIGGLRRAPWTRARIITIGTLAVSAAFYILSTYAYAGAVRYVAPVVPLLYGAAAAGVVRWWHAGRARRVAAAVLAVLVTIGLHVPRSLQARAVAAGASEQYLDWPGSFDPRPVLDELRRGGYRVCYGEVWVAHKLEWLSEPTVRFVPVRLVHRTLRQSLVLIDEPGVKCFVDNDGRVTQLSPEEEARWDESVRHRARKAGLLRVEGHAADPAAAAARIDTRRKELAEVRHLEEEMAVADAVNGDRDEEHREDGEEDARRRRGNRTIGAEELLRDESEKRKRKKDENGEKAARLNAEVRTEGKQAERDEEAEEHERGEVEPRELCRLRSPRPLQEEERREGGGRAADGQNRDEGAEEIARREERRHPEEERRNRETRRKRGDHRPRGAARERHGDERQTSGRTELARDLAGAGERQKEAECRSRVEKYLRHRRDGSRGAGDRASAVTP